MRFNSPPSKATNIQHLANQVQAEAKPRGVISRLGSAVMAVLNGVDPMTWMGPGAVQVPGNNIIGAYGRLSDYPVGWNTIIATRTHADGSTFSDLRALADGCDLVRLAIETKKDQITKVAWTIKNRDPKQDQENNPKADAIRKILEKPDGRTPWATWLRMLIEEVMVTDALAILPRKTLGGSPAGFEIMDGATIKPLVDETGREPEPPNYAYQQIIKGTVVANYTSKDLIYAPRNPRVNRFFGFSPVEQVMFTVNMAIRRSINQMEYFTEGNIPEAFATLPKEWTGAEIAAFQEYWDTTMEGQQRFKRKVKFTPGDTKIEQTKATILTDNFDEWLARVICYAFSLPPTQFVKQTTRVTGDVLQESNEREGLRPLMFWVKGLMDQIIHDYLGEDDLQFVWSEEDAIDPHKQADILEKYTRNAIMTINEARMKLGLPPNPDGNDLMFVTVAGAVALKYAKLEPAPGATPGDAPTPPTKPTAGTHKAPGTPVATSSPAGAVRQPATAQRGVKNGGNTAKAAEVGELTKHAFTHVVPGTDVERALAKTFGTALELAGESVASQFEKGTFAKAAGEEEDPAPAPTREEIEAFAASVDMGAFSLAWDDYTKVLYITTDDGVKTALARVAINYPGRDDIPAMLGQRDPNAVKWATEHAAELLSKDGKSGALVDATRNMIRATLVQGLEQGLNRAQLADLLRKMYGFSQQRADLIATTEVRMAEGHGLLFGYKAANMEYKKWLMSSLEGICPACEANAAEGFIKIDEPFVSGADAPLQHPGCRCDLIASDKPE